MMNYLDRDLNKLYKYIDQLGLKFYTKKYTKFSGEAEYISNESITVYIRSRTYKSSIILSILHELGHHLDWLDKKDSKIEVAAMSALNTGKMMGKRSDLTKKERSVILNMEKAGVKYMSIIHRLLKLEIPFYKVKCQQECDLFQYKFLHKHGRFATLNESKSVINKLPFYKEKYDKRKK